MAEKGGVQRDAGGAIARFDDERMPGSGAEGLISPIVRGGNTADVSDERVVCIENPTDRPARIGIFQRRIRAPELIPIFTRIRDEPPATLQFDDGVRVIGRGLAEMRGRQIVCDGKPNGVGRTGVGARFTDAAKNRRDDAFFERRRWSVWTCSS